MRNSERAALLAGKRISPGASSSWPSPSCAPRIAEKKRPNTTAKKIDFSAGAGTRPRHRILARGVGDVAGALHRARIVVTFGVRSQAYRFTGKNGNIAMQLDVDAAAGRGVRQQDATFRDWMEVAGHAWHEDASRRSRVTFEAIRKWTGQRAPSLPLYRKPGRLRSSRRPLSSPLHAGGRGEIRPSRCGCRAWERRPMLEWDPTRFDDQAAMRMVGSSRDDRARGRAKSRPGSAEIFR